MVTFCLSGAALAALLALAAHWLSPLDPRALVALLAAFVPYAVAIRQVPRLTGRAMWAVLLGIAFAGRALLLPTPFALSNDVYRYRWEGRVLAAGGNPFRSPPAAPELAALRDADWPQIAHREVPSAYPPLLLQVFRLAATPPADVGVFKWIFAACDGLTILLLAGWLRARGLNPRLSIVWAWNPLVILEFAGMGHEMSLPIMFFVAGMWAVECCHGRTTAPSPFPLRRRGTNSVPPPPEGVGGRVPLFGPTSGGWSLAFAGALFACALLAHLMALPLVAAVVLAYRIGSWRFWLAFAATGVLLFLPFLDTGKDLVLGLTHFGARWEFNGSLFRGLVWLCGDDPPRQLAPDLWIVHTRAKYVAAAILAGVIAWTTWRRAEPARAAQAALAAVLLFSPTVHPWYLTWMVALLAVRLSPAWLLLTASVLLAYVAKLTETLDGRWYESPLVTLLVYGPFFAWWIVELVREGRCQIARNPLLLHHV